MQVSDLSGLEKFSALGELDLTSNAVTWPELFKLKHLQLLSLTLVGNPIEQDEKCVSRPCDLGMPVLG